MNWSSVATATNISAELVSLDSSVTVIFYARSDFPDIPAGGSSVSSERYTLSISEDWTGDSIPMQMNIESYGTLSWRDTFYIPVTIPVTDIDNNVRASKIRIYPNPANELLSIETDLSDHRSIEITSLNGQMIYSTKMEGTAHQVDLSSFRKGAYFITIRSKDHVTTRKIIKL